MRLIICITILFSLACSTTSKRNESNPHDNSLEEFTSVISVQFNSYTADRTDFVKDGFDFRDSEYTITDPELTGCEVARFLGGISGTGTSVMQARVTGPPQCIFSLMKLEQVDSIEISAMDVTGLNGVTVEKLKIKITQEQE